MTDSEPALCPDCNGVGNVIMSTCCGRGCNGCVWEGWLAAVAYWRDEASLLLD